MRKRKKSHKTAARVVISKSLHVQSSLRPLLQQKVDPISASSFRNYYAKCLSPKLWCSPHRRPKRSLLLSKLSSKPTILCALEFLGRKRSFFCCGWKIQVCLDCSRTKHAISVAFFFFLRVDVPLSFRNSSHRRAFALRVKFEIPWQKFKRRISHDCK